jgi:hypothetical protein
MWSDSLAAAADDDLWHEIASVGLDMHAGGTSEGVDGVLAGGDQGAHAACCEGAGGGTRHVHGV